MRNGLGVRSTLLAAAIAWMAAPALTAGAGTEGESPAGRAVSPREPGVASQPRRSAPRRAPRESFPTEVTGPGDFEQAIEHDGLDRRYLIHVPPSYRTGAAAPVVLAFHGGGGNALQAMESFGLNETADRHGFLAIYPEGSGRRIAGRHLGTWNTWKCCGSALRKGVDDVGFVSALIDDLMAKLTIDAGRIYATGISNGGMMAYRLGCELSARIAAIAPVGSPGGLGPCEPTRAVPLLHFHGTADPCAPYGGGDPCGGCFGSLMERRTGFALGRTRMSCSPIPAQIEDWARRNGVIGSRASRRVTPRTECVTYGSGQPGETTLCSVDGMGHVWPGAGPPLPCEEDPGSRACRDRIEVVGPHDSEVPANQMMWDFFARHELSTS